MADHEDVRSWGEREGLSNYVIDFLQDQGINTTDDVMGLSDDTLDIFQSVGLTEDQFARLMTAVDNLRHGDHPPSPSPTSILHQEQQTFYPSSYGAEPASESPHYVSHDHGLATERLLSVSDNKDVRSWGKREDLPNYVIRFLQDQGINTTDDVRGLSDDTLDIFQSVGLHEDQFARLMTAMDNLRQSGHSPFGEGFGNPSSYGAEPTNDITREFSQLNVIEEEDTVRLVLLGRTGCGKSTTGNTILGNDAFDAGCDFASVTASCKRAVGTRNNKKLEVLDCPGLFDTKMSQEEISAIVIQAVAALYPGPHAFLYVVRIGRYTEEEHGAYKRLKSLFDDRVTKHMILLFTGGDSLGGITGADASSDVACRILEKGPKELQEVFKECGERTVVFNNLVTDDDSQVDYLLKEVEGMMHQNGGRLYVCPKYASVGEKVEAEVARRIEKIEKEEAKNKKYVQKLEVEKKSAEEDVEKQKLKIKQFEQEKKRKEKEIAEKTKQMQDDHKRKLEEQARKAKEQQAQMERLKKEKENAERVMKQKERDMSKREKQRMRQEAENRQQEQERLQYEMQLQQERAEQDRRQQQIQMQQMQQQLQQMEGEYNGELRKLQERHARAEQQRERQRQQERADDDRRHRMRLQELESVKHQVVHTKSSGCCIS